MQIQSFKSENPILKSSIKCIYLIEQAGLNDSGSFLILPSVSSYFSVSLNTVSYSKDEKIIVESTNNQILDSDVQFGLKSSTFFEYRGKIKEICVVFNPLGIFNFFDEKNLLEKSIPFIPDSDFENIIKEILHCPDNDQMIAEIENYLLLRYKTFSHPYLRQAIEELEVTDVEQQITLEELARKLKITRQTLNSQFKKYLTLSTSEFRQISRLRRFIQAKLVDEDNTKLTDFVYDLGFFDQSHLIKEFKKYTFLKPNDFFRRLDHSKDHSILVIWQ